MCVRARGERSSHHTNNTHTHTHTDPLFSEDEKKKEFSDNAESLLLRRMIGAANSGIAICLGLAAHSGDAKVQRIALLSFLPGMAIHSLTCVNKLKTLAADKALQTKIDLGMNFFFSALIGAALILHKKAKEDGGAEAGRGAGLGFRFD